MGAYTRKPRAMLKYPKVGPGPKGGGHGGTGRAATGLDAAPASTPLDQQRLELTDDVYNRLRESLNNALHELVFAMQHMDQGDVEDTQNALVTASGTIETVADEYETLRKSKFPTS